MTSSDSAMPWIILRLGAFLACMALAAAA